MTHRGGKPHTNIGDVGQRYEVRYKDNDGKQHVFGWSDTILGCANLSRMITLHPAMHSPSLFDRVENKIMGD